MFKRRSSLSSSTFQPRTAKSSQGSKSAKSYEAELQEITRKKQAPQNAADLSCEQFAEMTPSAQSKHLFKEMNKISMMLERFLRNEKKAVKTSKKKREAEQYTRMIRKIADNECVKCMFGSYDGLTAADALCAYPIRIKTTVYAIFANQILKKDHYLVSLIRKSGLQWEPILEASFKSIKLQWYRMLDGVFDSSSLTLATKIANKFGPELLMRETVAEDIIGAEFFEKFSKELDLDTIIVGFANTYQVFEMENVIAILPEIAHGFQEYRFGKSWRRSFGKLISTVKQVKATRFKIPATQPQESSASESEDLLELLQSVENPPRISKKPRKDSIADTTDEEDIVVVKKVQKTSRKIMPPPPSIKFRPQPKKRTLAKPVLPPKKRKVTEAATKPPTASGRKETDDVSNLFDSLPDLEDLV